MVGADGSAAAEGQSQLGFITGSELMRSPRVPAVRLARRARSQWPRPRHHPRPLHHRPHPRRPHPRWPLATGFRARATVTSRAELADLVARSVGLVHVPRWHQTNHRFSLTSSNSRDSFGFLPLTLHFSVAVWILPLARWRPRTKGALQHGARAPDAAVAAVGPRPSPDGDGVGSPQWLLRAGDVPLPARPGPAAGRPLGSHEIYSGDQSLPLFRPNPEISNEPARHAAAQAGIRGRCDRWPPARLHERVAALSGVDESKRKCHRITAARRG